MKNKYSVKQEKILTIVLSFQKAIQEILKTYFKGPPPKNWTQNPSAVSGLWKNLE